MEREKKKAERLPWNGILVMFLSLRCSLDIQVELEVGSG